MVRRVGGLRRGTRSKLKKSHREKSKLSLTKYFQEFNIGDRVILNIEPSIKKGMLPPRFQGKVGEVSESTGECYKVLIKDKEKQKTIIVHPVHLMKVKE